MVLKNLEVWLILFTFLQGPETRTEEVSCLIILCETKSHCVARLSLNFGYKIHLPQPLKWLKLQQACTLPSQFPLMDKLQFVTV